MPPSARERRAGGGWVGKGKGRATATSLETWKENWAGKGKAKRKEGRATRGERGVQRLLREIDPE